MTKTPDYTQAEIDAKIQAGVLRLRARALRDHANSLSSYAVDRSLSKYMRSRYSFASQRAHDEADCLEAQAKELEN